MKKRSFFLLVVLVLLLPSCGNQNPSYSSARPSSLDISEDRNSTNSAKASEQVSITPDVTKISFKAASSYDYLLTLNNTKVEICGYMATSSPVDGSFIFLMNLPYQSCPFCKPNTSELSNTMEVYPKKGTSFTYTTQAIKVTGKLSVAPVGQNFTDSYGYEFAFKVVDADYKIMKEEDMPKELALWQKFSSSGLVTDIYSMYDYVYFLCCWPSFFVNSYVNSEGVVVPGFYLYDSDAIRFITTDGAQWNYGYKEGYFDKLIARLDKISDTGFEELKANIEKAHNLADYALTELFEGHYTSSYQFVEKFGCSDYIFKMNDTQLESKWENIYFEFTDWIGSFEM